MMHFYHNFLPLFSFTFSIYMVFLKPSVLRVQLDEYCPLLWSIFISSTLAHPFRDFMTYFAVSSITSPMCLSMSFMDNICVWTFILEGFHVQSNVVSKCSKVWHLLARVAGRVWQGVANYGKVWQGEARYGKVLQGVARCGMMWQSVARCGKVWQSVERCCKVWQGVARFGKVWQGVAKWGKVWQGVARCTKV